MATPDGIRMMHPFEVFYHGGHYYIFAPDGCVLVNGVAAEMKDAENGNVQLSFSEVPESLYAHVSPKEDGSSSSPSSGESPSSGGSPSSSSSDESDVSYEVTFDGNATKEGAVWNIRVTSFGQEYNDGEQYDIVTSAINLGGSATGGFVGDGVFVPLEDADGKVTSFAYRYYQIGGYTFEASDRTPAKTGTTLVALQLNATSWSSSTGPGGSLVEYASVSALQTAQSDPQYYRIPLYLITDGSVTVDFRRMPFTGMIEQFGSST